MNIQEQLKTLSEDDLRKKIVMPLLFALGCPDVRDTCGPAENGKDITYVCRTHFLREKIWGAVVMKKTDITKPTIDNLNRQINEAIAQFTDPDDPRNKIQLQEILVVTPRSVTDSAREYIYAHSGRSFQNIHIINGHKLEFLINEVILEYNQKSGETYVFNSSSFSNICGRRFDIPPEESKSILEGTAEGGVIN